jgi:hypothetical protein
MPFKKRQYATYADLIEIGVAFSISLLILAAVI